MGMAYGAGVIKKPLTALLLIVLFVILGATFESHKVVATVGTGIIPRESITPLGAMAMMLTAALVTAANTWMKWLVSTSQLACFAVVGAALAMGAPVNWGTHRRPPVCDLDRHADRKRGARLSSHAPDRHADAGTF
jgi:phosphate/sulfate permease